MLDENAVYVVHGSVPSFVGLDAKTLPLPADVDGNPLVPQVLAATEDGVWLNIPWPAVNGPENLKAHLWVVKHDGYFFGVAYYDSLPFVRTPTDDELTRAYVEAAIAYYEEHGREAAAAHYNSPASFEGERYLLLMEPSSDNTMATLLTFPIRPAAVGFTLPYPQLSAIVDGGDAGYWYEGQKAVNPLSGKEEPVRVFSVLHDGLVFASGHFILRDNLEAATKNYVNKATEYYDANGRQATIDHYNSREDSMDGQFYLFLIGADDLYLAHPIFPHLIGQDIKTIKDSTGYELGKEIAKATPAGHWVEYLWPNPSDNNREEPKFTWVKRHQGLIFASGYYEGEAGDDTPLACETDPQREYTVAYVNRAIERYQQDGLAAMKAYYNSVASYECEWYLFATDANDIYHVHPLVPSLIGTDIKDLTAKDVNGNPLGEELAKAGEGQGVWVEYMWLHPATRKDAPKTAYAVRRDGMLFASGFYPVTDDPEDYTQEYVRDAIAYYDDKGRDATFTHYQSDASWEGQWYLIVTDESGTLLVNPVYPHLVGTTTPGVAGFLEAIDAGVWHEFPWTASGATGEVTRRAWGLKHDGLYFWSGYFVER